jgi:hypothetical protein
LESGSALNCKSILRAVFPALSVAHPARFGRSEVLSRKIHCGVSEKAKQNPSEHFRSLALATIASMSTSLRIHESEPQFVPAQVAKLEAMARGRFARLAGLQPEVE